MNKPIYHQHNDDRLDLRYQSIKWHLTGRGPQLIDKDHSETLTGRAAVAINVLLAHAQQQTLDEFYDHIGITDQFHDHLMTGDVKVGRRLLLNLIYEHNINPLLLYANSSQVWCDGTPHTQ